MTNADSNAPIRSWASERLAAAIRQSLDRLARSDDVCHVAVQFRIDFPSSFCRGRQSGPCNHTPEALSSGRESR